MAKGKIKTFKALHSLRHRAVCDNGEWASAWTEDVNEAYEAAIRHQSTRPAHVVHVVTEQTTRIRV